MRRHERERPRESRPSHCGSWGLGRFLQSARGAKHLVQFAGGLERQEAAELGRAVVAAADERAADPQSRHGRAPDLGKASLGRETRCV